MKEKDIDFTLKKIQRKIWMNTIENSIVTSIFISAIVFFILAICAHIFPIVDIFKKGIEIFLAGMIVGVFCGILKYPCLKSTAIVVDSLGFKERFSTYLEYKDKDDEISRAFVEEVKKTIEIENPIKKYSIKINKKRIIIALIIFFISVGLSFIPSQNREIAKEKEDIQESLKEEVQEIEELKEYIEDEEDLETKEKQEIMKKLNKLETKLSKTFDYKEGAFSVGETQEELRDINGMNSNDFTSQISNGTDGKNSLNDIESTNGDFSREEEKIGDVFSNDENKDISKSNLKEKPMGETFEKLDIDLENMKERLLSKDEYGFESIGGKDKVGSFTEGQTSNLNSGEKSQKKSRDVIGGGEGISPKSSENGIGGSKSGDGKAIPFKKDGKIEKTSESNKINGKSKEVLNIEGKSGKGGQIKTSHSEKGLGVEGMSKAFESSYREFQKDKTKYIDKYSVAEEKKSLVKSYFEKLLEEN